MAPYDHSPYIVIHISQLNQNISLVLSSAITYIRQSLKGQYRVMFISTISPYLNDDVIGFQDFSVTIFCNNILGVLPGVSFMV